MANSPASLDDARARRTLAPFLGTFATGDDHLRMTVWFEAGHLHAWLIEGEAPARELFRASDELINHSVTDPDSNDRLGWHYVERKIDLYDGNLIFSEIRQAWWHREIDRRRFIQTGDGVRMHHMRSVQTRSVSEFYSWVDDANDSGESGPAVNAIVPLVRLSKSPVPLEEFQRSAPPRAIAGSATTAAPPPGEVIPFARPKACETKLDR